MPKFINSSKMSKSSSDSPTAQEAKAFNIRPTNSIVRDIMENKASSYKDPLQKK